MKQLNTQKTPSKLFCSAYVLLITVSTLYKYFLTVSLPWWSVQLSYIAISMLCCAWILVTGELSRVFTAIKATLLFLTPYLLVVLYSLALWLFRLESVYYIRRGMIDIAYLMLAVIMIGCSGMVFGEKLGFLTFLGFAIGNALIALSVVKEYGAGAVVRELAAFFASGFEADTTITKALEIHALTFALGGMLHGILLMRIKPFRKVWSALICVIFLLLGWKRSLWPAIGIGILIYCLTKSKKKKTVVWKIQLLGIAMTGIALAYVAFVHSGAYSEYIQANNISVMGRDILYNAFNKYYDVSLGYIGKGTGFPAGLLKELQESGHMILNGELSIHSDILAKYIELGMVCYLLWSYLNYALIGTILTKRFSERAGRMWEGCIAICYVTYFTDNTVSYMSVIIMLCSVVMSAIFEENKTAPALPGASTKGI